MHIDALFLGLLIVLGVLFASALGLVAHQWRSLVSLRPMRIVLLSSPSILMLLLFYSLAVHMHQSLGGWPSSIGMQGFPERLILHAQIATGYFGVWLLLNVLVWPMATLVCGLFPRRQAFVANLGAYGVACVVSFCILLLAPSRFLYWWWD